MALRTMLKRLQLTHGSIATSGTGASELHPSAGRLLTTAAELRVCKEPNFSMRHVVAGSVFRSPAQFMHAVHACTSNLGPCTASCRLANGVRFLLAQDPEAVFGAVTVSVQTGYFDDPPEGEPAASGQRTSTPMKSAPPPCMRMGLSPEGSPLLGPAGCPSQARPWVHGARGG